MGKDTTNEIKDSRSFEDRVFLRFDAMDARFDSMDGRCERIETRLDSLDGRVQNLEAKQYDTKPVWERALTAISELSARIDQTNIRFSEINARMDQGFEQVRSEMKASFDNQQARTEHLVRDVYWQIDALNNNVLKIQADQIYFNSRLRDVETTIKQS